MAIVSVMFTRALMITFLPLSNIAMHQSRLRLLYVFFAIAVRPGDSERSLNRNGNHPY